MTSVKTTSVNIASVVPVRKRALSGYAIDMRSTGASAADPAENAHDAREEEIGVEDDHPYRADDDQQAGDDPRREVHREGPEDRLQVPPGQQQEDDHGEYRTP